MPYFSKNHKKIPLNKNCWFVRRLGYLPAKRCRYCQLKLSQCPFFQYLLISVAIIAVTLLTSWLVFGNIPWLILFIVFFCILVYGYFFDRATVKIIDVNFKVYKANIELERKVKERTKELEELTKTLETRMAEKTKELKHQKEALEKEVAKRTKELRELNEKLEEEVEKRTKELKERIEDLQRINRLAVGRELTMIKMKEKIHKLEKGLEKCQKKKKDSTNETGPREDKNDSE